jgi:hypothetical protein
MQYTLSNEHRSVYRALKYLINGDGDGEELQKNVPSAGISTYVVKVATIKHHFTCSGFQKESQCLLDILGYLLGYFEEDSDNKILCKFNGSPFNIILDDRSAILSWLRTKIQKYEKKFLINKDKKQLLSSHGISELLSRRRPRYSPSLTKTNSCNSFNNLSSSMNKMRLCSNSSSTVSVTLARNIQYDRESLASGNSSRSGISPSKFSMRELQRQREKKQRKEQRKQKKIEQQEKEQQRKIEQERERKQKIEYRRQHSEVFKTIARRPRRRKREPIVYTKPYEEIKQQKQHQTITSTTTTKTTTTAVAAVSTTTHEEERRMSASQN